MVDDKNFLPHRSAGDYLHTATRAGLSLIPVAGGSAAELFSLVLADYPSVRKAELRERRQLTDPMVLDLNDRGLLIDPRPYVARTRESIDSLTIQGWTLSPLGKEFLSFIAPPRQIK
jgi:hypothetical protein